MTFAKNTNYVATNYRTRKTTTITCTHVGVGAIYFLVNGVVTKFWTSRGIWSDNITARNDKLHLIVKPC